jgi:FixJ family two-component response regulator
MRERAPTAHPLTPREEQVVELVAQDLPNRQIAERLGLTEFSVRNIVFRAGLKIPGDLPLRQRVRHWYNGGPAFREATK